MRKELKPIKITDDDHKKVKEIARLQERSLQTVLSYAVRNYHKITVGNTVRK